VILGKVLTTRFSVVLLCDGAVSKFTQKEGVCDLTNSVHSACRGSSMNAWSGLKGFPFPVLAIAGDEHSNQGLLGDEIDTRVIVLKVLLPSARRKVCSRKVVLKGRPGEFRNVFLLPLLFSVVCGNLRFSMHQRTWWRPAVSNMRNAPTAPAAQAISAIVAAVQGGTSNQFEMIPVRFCVLFLVPRYTANVASM
jgi:hypothetical protein